MNTSKLVNCTITMIGSRIAKDEPEVMTLFYKLTLLLLEHRVSIRSGSADGIDWACEVAANHSDNIRYFTSYVPWRKFGPPSKALRINASILPNKDKAVEILLSSTKMYWSNISNAVKELFTRNVYQVKGTGLSSDSNLCIYWSPIDAKGHITKGTSIAIRLCDKIGIPSFNLYRLEEWFLLKNYLLSKYDINIDDISKYTMDYESVKIPYTKINNTATA